VKKAKRLYGSDIISGSLREQTPLVWNIRWVVVYSDR
jgi:hypothetical protein